MATNCMFRLGDRPSGFTWVSFFNESGEGPGSVVVGICDGRCVIPACNGAPEGFLGGELTVDLEKRTSLVGRLFFLAHSPRDPDPAIEPATEPVAFRLDGQRDLVPAAPDSALRTIPYWLDPGEDPRGQSRREPRLR